MRWRVKADCVALLALALAGCAEVETAGLARPNLIIVREFAASEGVVTLDPSFGFSLYRGAAGVPPRQRAASVGLSATLRASCCGGPARQRRGRPRGRPAPPRC